MILNNHFRTLETVSRESFEIYVLLLSPFAPHLAEELWERLGHSTTLAYEAWPEYDQKYLIEDTIRYAVQVNGKLRDTFEISTDATQDEILRKAKSLEKIMKYIHGKTMVKEIVVPKKLVNLVVK